MSINYILSLRKILELEGELNQAYLNYVGPDIFEHFTIQQIYRFIINEIPPKLLKTITTFTFINDVTEKVEFNPLWGHAILENPLPGFSDEDMFKKFSKITIISGDKSIRGGGELDTSPPFEKVI